MRTLSVSLILSLLFVFGCKDLPESKAATLPFLGEVTMDSNTGEPVHYKAPDFELTDQHGASYSSTDVSGKIHVVDFFFTSCPTICPKMTSHLKVVQEHFKDDQRVRLLSYSIDGANDSPAVLNNYTSSYKIDADRWRLLTGNPTEIFEISRGYKVMSFEDSFQGEPNLVHDGTFVLLDGKRRIRGYYNGLDSTDTQRLISDMEILLNTL